jgi:hypothetical protein
MPDDPPVERIANSFNTYFADFDVRIGAEHVAEGNRGKVIEQPTDRWPRPSWRVNYRVGADENQRIARANERKSRSRQCPRSATIHAFDGNSPSSSMMIDTSIVDVGELDDHKNDHCCQLRLCSINASRVRASLRHP